MHTLHEELAVASDPISFYLRVRALASESEPLGAVAATLSTIGLDGIPSARMVLVKEVDGGRESSSGFVFYTNRRSAKGLELAEKPVAALVFHYPSLGVQVRVRGPVFETSDQRSDAYFSSRPRQSQLGAWASEQSSAIEGVDALLSRFRTFEERYAETIVPRPPHWGGYRVEPTAIEFWLEGPYRLHERMVFERKAGTWTRRRLAP